MKQVAIYIRVSTDAQAKKGDSLGEQMETLKKYIDDHDNLILYDTYIDDGVSGQKIDRGEFKRLMDDVKARRINLIIFTKLDRWFRSLRHYLNVQAVLEKHGVEWTAVAQPFYDTTTPQGRAFVAQSMTFAELEAQNDSVRIKDVFDYKYKRGEVLSGKTPLGYSIKDKHLVPNKDAEKAVAAFEHYDKTNSISDTLRFLSSEYGIVMCHDNLKRSILQNKKYIGIYRDNENFCEPIIDRELFDRIQYKLSKNIKSSQKRDYIFSGLIKCKCCGHNFFSFVLYCKKPDERRYEYKHYRCHYRLTRRCINKKTMNERTLEKYLINNVKTLLSDYVAEYKLKQKKTIDISKKKDAIEKRIAKLKELYLNDLISLEEFKQDKEKYTKELEALNEVPKQRDFSALEEFMQMDIEEQYKGLTEKEKRRFWRSIIREIVIDEEKNIEVIFL